MSDHPYRVGMARPVQRYIEPTEIYEDLKRGRATTMPPDFGYTWTPVNGLGSVADDLMKTASDALSQKAKEGAASFVESAAGKQMLDAVQASAREGVVKEVKKNAPNLIMFAIAGGAIGGIVSQKLGKVGTALAVGLAVWSGMQLMNPSEPAVPAPPAPPAPPKK